MTVDEAEIRGQALFNKPFPHDPNLSCAACHVPSGAYLDHAQHDVGSGGLFKTPTLLMPTTTRPISMTDALTATIRSWPISIASSISASLSRTGPISSPI